MGQGTDSYRMNETADQPVLRIADLNLQPPKGSTSRPSVETGLRGEGVCSHSGCTWKVNHKDLIRTRQRGGTRITAAHKIGCPEHPYQRVVYRVMTIVVTNAPCGPLCWTARRNSVCRCSCAGAGHGSLR